MLGFCGISLSRRLQKFFSRRIFPALLLIETFLAGALAVAAEPPDFAHDVVPILRKHCIDCHGGREAKGSFSLNTRELLLGSGHVKESSAADSHLIALVASPDVEARMPPKDREPLTSKEIDVLKAWIDAGISWEDGFSFAASQWEPSFRPRRPELPPARDRRSHPIDRILDEYLAASGKPIPARTDDATFCRRVHLDLVGLLPTPESLKAFLSDTNPEKRVVLIRTLLADQIAYADHWLTFFNDLLRNDYSGTGFITGGRKQISTWLYDALLTNKPFDQFTRELIAPPTPASQGYIDGIRWRGEVSAGQTVEIQFAQSISQSFLGINMKCASCHDSFIDRWKLDEAYGLAAIYSETPMQIHRCDKPVGREAKASWLFPEIGQVDPAAPREQRLSQLADLMTHPDNGRFTRTLANRFWYRLMGRGIVHPLDAMQTQPWNEDLLDYLAVEFRHQGYDLKKLLELIATSEAYQAETAFTSTEIATPESGSGFQYRGPLARRMTAEQFLDGIWQITGAAPLTMDAAVIRAVIDPTQAAATSLKGQWIWGASAAEGKLPAGGESILLKKSLTIADEIDRAALVMTCDNAVTLFVNGREVQKSSDWQKPVTAVLTGSLKKGDNDIVAVVRNDGSEPNSAGLYVEGRVWLKNGETIDLVSDETWSWNPESPVIREGRLGKVTGEWQPATVVAAIGAWDEVISGSVRPIVAQITTTGAPMIRASLVRSDFLMRSLGRPLREQIVSMRPSELTTLEAVDLANGPALSAALAAGAEKLTQKSEPPAKTVELIYEYALSRKPTAEELEVILPVIGDGKNAAAIEDFLWSVFMTPEYMVVR